MKACRLRAAESMVGGKAPAMDDVGALRPSVLSGNQSCRTQSLAAALLMWQMSGTERKLR